MYIRIAALLPRKVLDAFRREMDYLNISIDEKRFVGFLLIYAIALSFGIALNFYILFGLDMLISFPFFIMLFIGGTYLWLSIAAESKGKFVDTILPDALQLIASNIKSGLTTERALFVSARDEFGPLQKELVEASKRIMTGQRIERALLEIPRKIHSKVLERTVWLISKGITSGGQIADLLTQLADDLRNQNAITSEVQANISMYLLLIFFSAAIGGPVLFGISSFIVEVMSSQMAIMPSGGSGIGTTGTAGAMAGMASEAGAGIEPEFVIFFSIVALVVESIFAALTLGIIKTGKEKQGVKFLPIILIASMVVFFSVRLVLGTMFGDLI